MLVSHPIDLGTGKNPVPSQLITHQMRTQCIALRPHLMGNQPDFKVERLLRGRSIAGHGKGVLAPTPFLCP